MCFIVAISSWQLAISKNAQNLIGGPEIEVRHTSTDQRFSPPGKFSYCRSAFRLRSRLRQCGVGLISPPTQPLSLIPAGRDSGTELGYLVPRLRRCILARHRPSRLPVTFWTETTCWGEQTFVAPGYILDREDMLGEQIFVAPGYIFERGGEAQSDRQNLTADER